MMPKTAKTSFKAPSKVRLCVVKCSIFLGGETHTYTRLGSHAEDSATGELTTRGTL